METKHLEKRIRKYVIAALSSPTMYLYKKPGTQEYKFFKDIEKSIKFIDKEDAEDTIRMYQKNVGDVELELVILPLEIDYYLIEENYNFNNYNLEDILSYGEYDISVNKPIIF